jgi:hypothetical protein
MENVFTSDSNEHYFRSQNHALPQDSHSLRGSTRDLWTVFTQSCDGTVTSDACLSLLGTYFIIHCRDPELKWIQTDFNKTTPDLTRTMLHFRVLNKFPNRHPCHIGKELFEGQDNTEENTHNTGNKNCHSVRNNASLQHICPLFCEIKYFVCTEFQDVILDIFRASV